MADRSVATTDTLETLRTTFNSTAGDVGDIASITSASGVIASATDIVEAITAINTEVNSIKSGTAVFETKITFEGDTDDAYETILAITDLVLANGAGEVGGVDFITTGGVGSFNVGGVRLLDAIKLSGFRGLDAGTI